MCYVIVTGRSLLWTLMSLAAAVAISSALVTPRWLVGAPTIKNTVNGTELCTPSVGIFNRCTRLDGKIRCGNFNSNGLATSSSQFPDCWKATLFFMAFGMAVMTITVMAALMGCCVQSIGRKSIFDLAGVGQSIAGIMYLLGMTLYAAGWGSTRVRRLCGDEAAPFYLGGCSLGWAFYCAVLGVLLTFVSAVSSGQAEKSTASDEVQDKINEDPHVQEIMGSEGSTDSSPKKMRHREVEWGRTMCQELSLSYEDCTASLDNPLRTAEQMIFGNGI